MLPATVVTRFVAQLLFPLEITMINARKEHNIPARDVQRSNRDRRKKKNTSAKIHSKND